MRDSVLDTQYVNHAYFTSIKYCINIKIVTVHRLLINIIYLTIFRFTDPMS